jgi:probable HAF family extracellular repeat protein
MKTQMARLAATVAAAFLGTMTIAEAGSSEPETPRAYHVFNLASLGGTDSAANSINNLGFVSGYSNLNGDQTRHATLWLYGLKLDLGTLGGPNSNVRGP